MSRSGRAKRFEWLWWQMSYPWWMSTHDPFPKMFGSTRDQCWKLTKVKSFCVLSISASNWLFFDHRKSWKSTLTGFTLLAVKLITTFWKVWIWMVNKMQMRKKQGWLLMVRCNACAQHNMHASAVHDSRLWRSVTLFTDRTKPPRLQLTRWIIVKLEVVKEKSQKNHGLFSVPLIATVLCCFLCSAFRCFQVV